MECSFRRSWPECVGMNADDAVSVIRSECTDCSVVVLDEVDFVDADDGIGFARYDGPAHR